jgi:L-arabinokinase
VGWVVSNPLFNQQGVPMWRIETPAAYRLDDVERFVALVNEQAGLFEAETPITVARAPGRLDLMGGIADYSGALVLQLPLAAATFVALQLTDERTLTLRSTTAAALGAASDVVLPLDDLFPPSGALGYADAHALLTNDPKRAWIAYVAGVLLVLQRERGVQFMRGMRMLIHSDVPPGKGVSSSAALEVATMQAVAQAHHLHLDGREMALQCQMVENQVVGAPCGIMDQMTSVLGEQDRLLALLCQPAELEPSIALPSELEVWGIDSGIRHAVTGADYGSVRAGAFMGYRIIADHAGLPVMQNDHTVTIADEQWGGYLANITPSEWQTTYCDAVPVTLDGAIFLKRYGGSTDTVTRIDPARTYAVRQPTAHPIYEHHRVRLFRTLLQHHLISDEHVRLLGELMYQSHASYSACGLGSSGTDRLVALVQTAGPDAGLYGAKITGGGSGGTVAVLARRGAHEAIERIIQQYAAETEHTPEVLGGSSPGAVRFGSLRFIA